MKRVTVVCCYNNLEEYESLIKSIYTQNEQCAVIGINNTQNNSFSSCSLAFNSVIKKIKTKYVIFSHQDITFSNQHVIRDFVDYLENIPRNSILGVAGRRIDDKYTRTNVKYKDGDKYAGSLRVNGLEECFSIDECFFGGETDRFLQHPFNEQICNNWHLYAVEQCLWGNTHGFKTYVCDIELVHTSQGVTSNAFYRNYFKLCRFYKKSFSEIATTCVYSKTDLLHRSITLFKGLLKNEYE